RVGLGFGAATHAGHFRNFAFSNGRLLTWGLDPLAKLWGWGARPNLTRVQKRRRQFSVTTSIVRADGSLRGPKPGSKSSGQARIHYRSESSRASRAGTGLLERQRRRLPRSIARPCVGSRRSAAPSAQKQSRSSWKHRGAISSATPTLSTAPATSPTFWPSDRS